MTDDPIDFQRERMKRAPRTKFIHIPPNQVDAREWVSQLYHRDGTPVQGVTGLDFGISPLPGFVLTCAQARALGEALILIAGMLEGQAKGQP